MRELHLFAGIGGGILGGIPNPANRTRCNVTECKHCATLRAEIERMRADRRAAAIVIEQLQVRLERVLSLVDAERPATKKPL